MPDTPFPTDRVLISDPTSMLGLRGDSKAFVHFNFVIIEEVDCPVINRIVIGQDRAAVGKFHNDHLSDIPRPKRASGTSRLGFGQVAVVDGFGEPKLFDDTLIMIAEEVPDPATAQATKVATRITIAKNARDMSAEDESKFVELQTDCTSRLTPDARRRLTDFMGPVE